MMFIYKITELKNCVSLHEHLDVTFAENDAAVYTPCLGSHRKLILTAFILNFSHLKIMHIQKIKKKPDMLIKNTLRSLFERCGSYFNWKS